jgi:hypothetical protein
MESTESLSSSSPRSTKKKYREPERLSASVNSSPMKQHGTRAEHKQQQRPHFSTLSRQPRDLVDEMQQFVESSPFTLSLDASSRMTPTITRERSGTDAVGRSTFDHTQFRLADRDSSSSSKSVKRRSLSVEDAMDAAQRKELQQEIERANKRLANQQELSISGDLEDKLLKTLSSSKDNTPTKDAPHAPHDLHGCLRDDQLSFVFWVYLREQYVHEHFSFCLAVQEFREQQTPNKESAMTIVKRYFRAGKRTRWRKERGEKKGRKKRK